MCVFVCLKEDQKKKLWLISSECQGLAEEEKLMVNQEVSAGTDVVAEVRTL